jgi:hypothetical protein
LVCLFAAGFLERSFNSPIGMGDEDIELDSRSRVVSAEQAGQAASLCGLRG